MADKMLKDVIKCECGFEMFPYAIHKDDETVLYKCVSENCECTKLLSLREATLGPEDMFTYFCLDDDGNMYWKCGIHGNCQSDLKWLASGWKNKVNKFIDYGCGYELDIEEVMDESSEIASNGK